MYRRFPATPDERSRSCPQPLTSPPADGSPAPVTGPSPESSGVDKIGPVVSAGIVYGVVWWVLGALLIMPLWLSVTADPMMRGMVLTIGSAQWMSLMGHVIFGLITAATLYGLRRRARS